MTDAAWAALTLALTLMGVLYTIWAFRSRGAAAGLRGAGLTLLPVAAYLSGTLELFTEITGSVVDWATNLVFNPMVWAGVGSFGLALLLLLVSARLRARELRRAGAAPSKGTPAESRPAAGTATPRASLPRSKPPATGPIAAKDDDMDEIEKILRKHGIS